MGKTIKRPKLATSYSGDRKGARDVVSLEASCRVGDGEPFSVGVLDLDIHGCRVRGFTAAVTKTDRVEVTVGEVGPVRARVRWAKRGSAGLKFDAPLLRGELAKAAETAMWEPPSRVVQLRRAVGDPEGT